MYVGHAAVCKVETEPNFGRTRTTAVSLLYLCTHTCTAATNTSGQSQAGK